VARALAIAVAMPAAPSEIVRIEDREVSAPAETGKHLIFALDVPTS